MRHTGANGSAQRTGPPPLAVLGAVVCALLLAACGPAWVRMDDSCVRDDGERPTARAINQTDPELCDRPVKERPRHHLRVPPPEPAG